MTFSIITNTRGSFAMVSVLDGPLLLAVFAYSRKRGRWRSRQRTWIGTPPPPHERERLAEAAHQALVEKLDHAPRRLPRFGPLPLEARPSPPRQD